MSQEDKKQEDNEIGALPSLGSVSFAKALGITFIILGVIGAIGTMVMYDGLPYGLQEEMKVIYFAIGGAALLGNLAIGSIIITLDRIAIAVEENNSNN